jgi:hypothetical protein
MAAQLEEEQNKAKNEEKEYRIIFLFPELLTGHAPGLRSWPGQDRVLFKRKRHSAAPCTLPCRRRQASVAAC